MAQTLLSRSTKYAHLATGLFLFGVSTGGYSGLKSVVYIDLVDISNFSKILMIDSLVCWGTGIIFPSAIGFLSAYWAMPKLLFYINALLCFLR